MYLLIPRQYPSANSAPDSIQDASFEGRVRLDNRSELALSLGIPEIELANFPDRTLTLKAYIKWGNLCVEHLLGDFAFSIFDPKNDEIFCARDHMGIEPFYFCFSDDSFVFADNIQQLVEKRLVSSALDDHSVCCYLRDGEFYHPEKTFYRDVKKLPPGHAMRIRNWEQSSYAYWSLEGCVALEFESQQDCSDQLRKLLVEAVSSRIRNTGSFGIHLSGGLDSSGIAAITRKVLNAPADDVRGYTWNFEP